MEDTSQMEQGHLHGDGHPGPHEDSVLNLQSQHRSTLIWKGDEVSTYHPLVLRRCDGAFQEAYSRAPDRVRDMIDVAGFGGVARASHLQVDHALITALVERWRPETHTFHLPVGEATVTLQDVAIIWGLRVDGDPVINNTHSLKKSEWQVKCQELLGFRPDDSQISGNRIMKSAIEPLLLVPLPDDVTDDELAQRARRFILILIGGQLFSDKSGKFLPLKYLLFLEDLQHSGTCSWGSAVLAYLYRCLCTAARAEAREICGPMVLLQIWAWEHIPIMRPDGKPPTSLPDLAPYGARWVVSLDLHRLPTHVLVAYRDQLDALFHNQFVWLPYSEEVIQSLPPQYVEGSDIWRSSVPLICWGIIEYHLPARVMRQFGLEQCIPPECNTDIDLHRTDQRGNDKKTWRSFYAHHVDAWGRRHECIVTGDVAANVQVPLSEYMDWYLKITRLLIGNPSLRAEDRRGYQSIGASSVIMARTMRRCHRICDEAISQVHDVGQLHAMFATIRDAIGRTLNMAGDTFGSVPSANGVIPSTCEPLRRPKDKIERRGHPGHRVGGKRRLQDRDLGDIKYDPHVNAEVEAPLQHVPVDMVSLVCPDSDTHTEETRALERVTQLDPLDSSRVVGLQITTQETVEPQVAAVKIEDNHSFSHAEDKQIPVEPEIVAQETKVATQSLVDASISDAKDSQVPVGPEAVSRETKVVTQSEVDASISESEAGDSQIPVEPDVNAWETKVMTQSQIDASISEAEGSQIPGGSEVGALETKDMTQSQVDASISEAEGRQIPVGPEVTTYETEVIVKEDPLVSHTDVIQRPVGFDEDQVVHRHSKRPRRPVSSKTPR